jgi:hypothetical protein
VPANALFGACLAALGLMHARIEAEDAERGLITATIGGGMLGARGELVVHVTPAGAEQSRLVATWRAAKRGADRRSLPIFLETVATFLPAGAMRDD